MGQRANLALSRSSSLRKLLNLKFVRAVSLHLPGRRHSMLRQNAQHDTTQQKPIPANTKTYRGKYLSPRKVNLLNYNRFI